MVFSSNERKKINQIIPNHDWAAFSEYYKKYGNEYFPDKISVYTKNEENDDYEIDNIPLNEETFKLITFTECECG